MKVTIEVTKKEAKDLIENWGKASPERWDSITALCCIKLARAIKKMEREK